jgi:DNA-binding CsgD family transcriptional regulator
MHTTIAQKAPRQARRPTLIVKVDVAEADRAGAGGRCDVSVMRPGRETYDEQWQREGAGGGEVTAVVILRDASPSHVVSCVRAATRGGGSIPPELLRQLQPAEGGARAEASGPQLSEREYDVLRMLADGESTRGIAEQLSYSERTVKNIVRDLLDKLNCRTRAHAVALAARQGVI